LCEVRAELRKLINAQVSDCDDAELKELQSNLTKAYDKFVEKSLLGAMLISEEALTTCMGSLIEDDFYEKNAKDKA